MTRNLLVSACIIAFCVYACRKPTERTHFDKVYDRVSDPENRYFWEQFHTGNIENVKTIISRLEKQVRDDSTNLVATAHLAFANFWAMSEGPRSTQPLGNLTDFALPAYRHFTKAYQLNPNDKRVLGFLADAEMAYGQITQSGPLQQQGYLKGMDAIAAWPEFNKFTITVPFTGAPPQADVFKAALEWQWTTLEDCYTKPIDRSNPAIQPLLSRDMSGHNLGRDRACYNSWIAPHNIEGYFLNMGDMIVKTGDHATAIKVYELAKASPNYDTWAYKQVLENRIRHAERNTATFLDPSQQGIDNVIIAASGSLCMSCHKMSDADQQRFRQYDWEKFFRVRDIYSINGLKE